MTHDPKLLTLAQQTAELFVDLNLKELAAQMVARSLGEDVPSESKYWRLVSLCSFSGSSRIQLAEALISAAALKKVASDV